MVWGVLGVETCRDGAKAQSGPRHEDQGLAVDAGQGLDVSAVLGRKGNALMKLVVIESPFAGDVAANVEYAKRCVRDCLARGESPYASHLFFTQRGILDDADPTERKLGIDAGIAWARAAEAVVVYIDRGISSGMRYGIGAHLRLGKAIFIRSLEREVSVQEIGQILEGLRSPDDPGVAITTLRDAAIVTERVEVERLDRDRDAQCLECKGIGHLIDPNHDGGQRCCPACGGQGYQD